MTLYLIGLGLDRKDLSIKGLEAIKSCLKIYLDNYTGILLYPIKELEELIGKEIILADRELIEKHADEILKENTAFLVVGDPLGATTHYDLIIRAKALGIETKVIHNISILSAIGIVGLQLYKYGKTSSIVFPDDDWRPETPYNVIKENAKNGLHSLLLLDIKVKEPKRKDILQDKDAYQKARFMTVKEGIDYLLAIEKKRKEGVFSEDTMCVGCARIGTDSEMIVFGSAKELRKIDFGEPLHCLVVPGKLHFMEQEVLDKWKSF